MNRADRWVEQKISEKLKFFCLLFCKIVTLYAAMLYTWISHIEELPPGAMVNQLCFVAHPNPPHESSPNSKNKYELNFVFK